MDSDNPFHPPEPPTTVQGKESEQPLGLLAGRSVFGGVLMGLANLVPGISGGTMLLAAGVYPAFIDALSQVTKFRFTKRSVLVLGLIAVSAGVGILLLAGTLKGLVVDYRWVMYSLFIGLTLGGVPVVWRLATERGAKLFVPAVVAFIAMAVLAWMQENQIVGGGGSNYLVLFFAGLAGASAMILPGVSGGYLLLLMGQYVPILGAIDEFKDAVKARDLGAAAEPALQVMLPVGVGVLVGIVVVGNLLKWLLDRYHTQTLGVLLGLLIGSTVGLYPFQEGVPPRVGDLIKGSIVSEATIDEIEPDDWLTERFVPTPLQVAGAFGLVFAGVALTLGVSYIGRDRPKS